jgi:hypothetical protein
MQSPHLTATHPSPPPQRGEGIFFALNAFLAKLPPSSNTSPDFWVKLSIIGAAQRSVTRA